MSTAERSETDIDAELATEFCRELRLRIDEMKGALATWGAARDTWEAARDAVEPAKKRAWTAQLRKAADADELTRRFEEARMEVDRARRDLAAAKQAVRDAVEAAESDVCRMRNVTLHAEAASRVERMAVVATLKAQLARDEAGLGPSPEEEDARQSRDALARAEAMGESSMAKGQLTAEAIARSAAGTALATGPDAGAPRSGAVGLPGAAEDAGALSAGKIRGADAKVHPLCPDDTPVYGYPNMRGVLADVFQCHIGGTKLKNALNLGRVHDLTTPGRALKAGAIANCFTRHKGRRKCKTTYGSLRAYAEWHRTIATR